MNWLKRNWGNNLQLKKFVKEIIGVIIIIIILIILSSLIQQNRKEAYESGLNHEPLEQNDQYQDSIGW